MKSDGTVWTWGNNSNGQIGDGSTTQRNSPIAVGSMGNVVTVAAAFGSSMFLKAVGKVWGCGANSNSQIGDGTSIQRTTPVQVSGGLVGVHYSPTFHVNAYGFVVATGTYIGKKVAAESRSESKFLPPEIHPP